MTLREGPPVRVQFAGGVETKSDPKAVPSVRLLALENGVFTRAISIKKRNGYESIADIDGAIRTATRDDELLAFTRTRSTSLQSDGSTSDAGAVFSVVATDRPLVATGTQQTMPDQASLAGVTVAAWEDSRGGVWWSVTDTTTERILRAPTQADAVGRSPRCVPCGPNLHVYYAVPSMRRLMVLVISPEAPGAAVTPAILTDDLEATNPVYDACSTTRTGTPAAIAWVESATTAIRFGYVDQSGVLGGPLTGHPSILTFAAARSATTPVAIAYTFIDGGINDRLTLAYVPASLAATIATFFGGDASTAILFINAGSGYTAVSVQRIALATTGATSSTVLIWVAWEESAVAASNRFVVAQRYSPAAIFQAGITIRSVGLASRAYAIDADVFAVFVHDTTYFNTYLTLRLADAVCVGRHVPAAAAGAPTRPHLSNVHVFGSVALFALPWRVRLTTENNDKFRETSLRLFTMDFASDASHQYAQLGRGLYLGGACPQHYDGSIWSEQGFHFGPELVATVPAAGGSLTSGTTYEYRYWYEWTDAQGEVHRGPTSIGTVVTMGGGDTQVTHTLPTLRVTGKANVRICVARTEAAKTGKTAQLFRVTSLDPSASGPNGYVANDTTVDTVTFVDRMSDVTLATQEELYTDGGILSNDPSALGSVVARGQSRLFFTDPSDGNVIRFSQPLDDGFGVEIPPDLTIRTDPFGGDVTAIAFADGRGFAWKRDAIFTFAGDGPLPNGDTATSGFTTPQLLPGDAGCTNPSSIVITPAGFMYQSSKGIHLLARDGTVQYVGAPVEAYNAQRVVRATTLPDRTAVLFLTDSGLSLLYDYLFGQWSTFSNHEGLDAAVVSNTYHYVRADGRVFRETPGIYSDAGTRIRLRLETAWLHMVGHLQGFQRFWYLHVLGTWVSAHQFGIQYQTDYTPGWTDSYWLDATGESDSTGWITGGNAAPIGVESIVGTGYGDGEYGDGPYGGTAPGLYQWRLGLNEKGQSIQLRFEDFEANGFLGASFELTELVITGGVKASAPRPFQASRST